MESLVLSRTNGNRWRPPDAQTKKNPLPGQLVAGSGSGVRKVQAQGQALAIQSIRVDRVGPMPYPTSLDQLLGLTRQQTISTLINHGWKPVRRAHGALVLVRAGRS